MVIFFLHFVLTIKNNVGYLYMRITCLIVISTPAGIFVWSNSINIGANVDDKFSICMHVRQTYNGWFSNSFM